MKTGDGAEPSATSVGRPVMPASYGLRGPAEGSGLMAWGRVEARLIASLNYWVATASPAGQPHAAPVWGLWHQGAFYFSTDPSSRKGRNLAANAAAAVHLESGDDVVILEGDARPFDEPKMVADLDRAYFAKYGFHLVEGAIYRLQPKRAMGWIEADFPGSATRWQWAE